MALLLLSFFLSLTPPSYSAIVVDARTGRPLVGVSVHDLKTSATVLTDSIGHFSMRQAPVQLQLNFLGYAPLRIERSATLVSRPDTLRLLSESMVLGDVIVRPGKVTVLSTVPAKGAHLARGLSPDQAIAMFLAPPAQTSIDKASLIDQIHLFMLERPQEGRIRVRIVDVLPGLTPGSSPRPGPADLLPEAAVFSLTQLQSCPRGELIVDVSKYSLLMPPTGICVVIECLPTNPDDQVVAVTQSTDGKHHTQIVLAPNPKDLTTAHTVGSEKYPVFEGHRASDGGGTWLRLDQKQLWRRQSGEYQTNIRSELKIYTY